MIGSFFTLDIIVFISYFAILGESLIQRHGGSLYLSVRRMVSISTVNDGDLVDPVWLFDLLCMSCSTGPSCLYPSYSFGFLLLFLFFTGGSFFVFHYIISLEQRVHSCIKCSVGKVGHDFEVLLSGLEVAFGFYELRESGMI